MSLEDIEFIRENQNWDCKLIKEVADVYIGRTPPRKEPEWFSKDHGIKWVSIKDLGDCDLHIENTSEYLVPEAISKFNFQIAPKNTILLSFKLTVGRVAITSEEMVTNEAIAQFIIKNKSVLSNLYLYYYLKNFNYNSLGSTSSIAKAINSKMVKEIPILLPPIEIQNQIAKILYELDSKIENLRKINHNLISQIEAIYYSWFVYYDNYSIDELEEYEIGLKPKEWDLLSLGDVTTKIKDKVGNNTYKVFSAVNTGNLQLSEEYFDKQVFSKDIKKYIIVKQKEFAYNPARINIGSIGRNDFDFDGCVSPVYVAFKVEKGYENFMNLFIKSSRFNQWVNTLSSGSVRQTLNYEDFSIIKIAYPPLNLVEEFNKIYNAYYEVINYNRKLIEKLENIRDLLLPKLMSGEIDVSEVNCDLKLIIRKFIFKIISYLEDLI